MSEQLDAIRNRISVVRSRLYRAQQRFLEKGSAKDPECPYRRRMVDLQGQLDTLIQMRDEEKKVGL